MRFGGKPAEPPLGGERLQKGVVLAIASALIGLLTTMSGVIIELSSGMLADMRHGICVERLPGDTRPLWQVTFEGGWRPYDRMSCCGGSASVDHATQECRAQSIIQHSTRKNLAFPVRSVSSFGEVSVPSSVDFEGFGSSETPGLALTAAAADVTGGHSTAGPLRRPNSSGAPADAAARGGAAAAGDGMLQERATAHGASSVVHHSSANFRRKGGALSSQRADHNREAVGADAAQVRAHMSHLFAPDPSEPWAEEFSSKRRRASASLDGGEPSDHGGAASAQDAAAPFARSPLAPQSLAEETVEVAVNEGTVQTRTESAGSLEPYYEWVPWERAMPARGKLAALLIYVAGTGLLAMLAALVTWYRPAAKGSGIPEVKACVAGFWLPSSFRAQTLVAKVVALSLCVGAGLAVGKEGPMIHIGACWGALLALPIARLGKRYSDASVEETELVCVGAAAGIAAAFGAPLAGVLFAVEELGTTMPAGLRYSTMLCAFGSAVTAALTLKSLDLARTQRLTLFEVDYRQAWAPWEALPFCLLGACGGVLGGCFVLANEAVHKRRLRAEAEGRPLWYLPGSLGRAAEGGGAARLGACLASVDGRILEVVALAMLTGLSNYPHMLTRMLQNDAIKALFSQCPADATPHAAGHLAPRDPIGLCGNQDDLASLLSLVQLLLFSSLLRFLQTVATFGALTPAGLFVPSLYMGGCLGRALGGLLKYIGLHGAQGAIEPGIYAMVGAGAVLAGVSRLTLSLAVVLFELTGGLTYVVPFMLAVLIGKWTGDAITNGRSVYDVHSELKGFAKVEQPDDVRLLNATLADLYKASGIVEESAAVAAAAAGLGANGAEADTESAMEELPAVLWVTEGRLSPGALAEHAARARPGFAVVSVKANGDFEVLGWADSDRVLAGRAAGASARAPEGVAAAAALAAAAEGAAKLKLWQRVQRMAWLGGGHGGDHGGQAGPEGCLCQQLLDKRAVVQVQSSCPLQTAYCVFENCPHVRALLAVDPASRQHQTVTRERFTSQLRSGCLFPCPSAAEERQRGWQRP